MPVSTSRVIDETDAASKLATLTNAKAGHELVFGPDTKEALEAVVQNHQANETKMDEATVLKLVSTCLDATAEMRREKQMLRLYDDNGLDRDAAGDLLDEINTIDKSELLTRLQQEIAKMKKD